ncbi:SatD family protein [Aureivirga sp. CE67]|uniref:SatD family protein n=1 Tax=Aureivirga sp. CE67 TaxID=1788983 RepID=UPI0018CAA71E|nr:SatD family protein [Aureivirga sp. CE67]
MVSVITGDIINSRNNSPEIWLKVLKEALQNYGEEYANWEIFRGDSFQLLVENSEEVLKIAIYLKAALKQIKGIDVRMGIGIGNISFQSSKVSQANGEVFIFSGEAFEDLKKKTILIKTNNTIFDEEMNLYLELGLLKMDFWSVREATLVKTILDFPDYTQSQLAEKLEKTQSTISETLKRSCFDEIMKIEKMFKEKLNRK